MPKPNELTVREKAAIRLYLYENEDVSPVLVYKIAHAGALEHVESLKDLPANASRWIRSRKVLAYLDEQRAVLNDRKEKERLRIESEIIVRMKQTGDSKATMTPAGMVDYSNPQNVLAKLNTIINTTADAGEALDAMKLLLAKQAELKPATQNEPPSRFYLPMACKSCVLYQMAGDVLRLRSAQSYNCHDQNAKANIDAKLRAGGRAIVEKYYHAITNHKK